MLSITINFSISRRASPLARHTFRNRDKPQLGHYEPADFHRVQTGRPGWLEYLICNQFARTTGIPEILCRCINVSAS